MEMKEEEEESNLDSWIATTVEDLAGLDANDGSHGQRCNWDLQWVSSSGWEEDVVSLGRQDKCLGLFIGPTKRRSLLGLGNLNIMWFLAFKVTWYSIKKKNLIICLVFF